MVGSTGVVVNLGIVSFLNMGVGIHENIAGIISVEGATISNFLLNDHWTFQDRRHGSILVRALKFHAVSFFGAYIVQYGVYLCFAEDGHVILPMLLGIAAGTFWNFGVNLLWTYRKKKD